MNQLSGMHILDAFEHLVHDVSLMNLLHDSCPDNSMKICFHKIKNQVNILWVLGFDYVKQTDYVWMAVELLEKNNLN